MIVMTKLQKSQQRDFLLFYAFFILLFDPNQDILDYNLR